MSGIYFEYGSYKHPVGEVYPKMIEMRPIVSERGYRWAYDYRMQIGGNFCGRPQLTPGGVDSRILALEAAYNDDYKNFGFRFSADDSKTAHYIETNDTFNLSGNKVIQANWDYSGPSELANTRSFAITLGAKIASSYSNIIDFFETVSEEGTGGPDWTYRTRATGIPLRQDIHQNTPVVVTQQGRITGLISHPAPPPPWWPSDEYEPGRVVTRTTPRLHGHPSFAKATHYTTLYRYVFLRPVATNLTPGVWYT